MKSVKRLPLISDAMDVGNDEYTDPEVHIDPSDPNSEVFDCYAYSFC